MKKFIVIYHADFDAMQQMQNSTPEQREEGMKQWMAWKDTIGDALVDFGAPLMGGQRLLTNGTSEDSKREVTGYSVLQAESMDAAKALLQEHPHLKWEASCTIEVHEAIPM